MKIQSADWSDRKTRTGQMDPPLNGLIIVGNHGMSVIYNFNEIYQARIVDVHIPAHAIGKWRRHGEWVGRSGQTTGFMNPMEQKISVIGINIIPRNILGHILTEHMTIVGSKFIAEYIPNLISAGCRKLG